jgi:hypothetical protein
MNAKLNEVDRNDLLEPLEIGSYIGRDRRGSPGDYERMSVVYDPHSDEVVISTNSYSTNLSGHDVETRMNKKILHSPDPNDIIMMIKIFAKKAMWLKKGINANFAWTEGLRGLTRSSVETALNNAKEDAAYSRKETRPELTPGQRIPRVEGTIKMTIGQLKKVVKESVKELTEAPRRAPSGAGVAAGAEDWQLLGTEEIVIQERFAGIKKDTPATAHLYKPGPNSAKNVLKSVGYVAVVFTNEGKGETYWSGSGYIADAVKKAFRFKKRMMGAKWFYYDFGEPIGEPTDRARRSQKSKRLEWVIPFGKK